MQSHSNMSDYLPVEIVIEILKRLPVVSIIGCRSVCKSWWSLISTPYFITIHLNFSLSKTQNQLLLCHFDLNIRKHRFTLHSSDDPFPHDHFIKLLNFSDPEKLRCTRFVLASGETLIQHGHGISSFHYLSLCMLLAGRASPLLLIGHSIGW